MNVYGVHESAVIKEYGSHQHDCIEVVYVSSGKMTIKIDDLILNVSEGDVIVIPSYTDHEGYDGENFKNIYMHTADMEFTDVIQVKDIEGSIKSAFYMLLRVMSEKEPYYKEISGKLAELLSVYIKKYSKCEFKYDFVLRIKDLIYENISNSAFSISKEVRSLGYNTDYFRRCFFEELGETPVEYMSRLRIERAKGLLIQKNKIDIATVAQLCGYDDSFYFSKVFKKHVGCSPTSYRNNHLLL